MSRFSGNNEKIDTISFSLRATTMNLNHFKLYVLKTEKGKYLTCRGIEDRRKKNVFEVRTFRSPTSCGDHKLMKYDIIFVWFPV